MVTPSSSSTAAAGELLKCPTLSTVIESAVTRSLYPKHMFIFKGFRRGMPGLCKDLLNNPPTEEEESHLLEIFPSSFSKKMCEFQWQMLGELIEHPLGGRYQRFFYDWVSYGSTCCVNCKRCSVFCDTNQRQKTYSLIRKRDLEEAESFEERVKIRNLNPPLLHVVAPVDDVQDCFCFQDSKNLAITSITPPPPRGFEFKSFFDQQDGDSDDELLFTDDEM